jgi:hypothetical protein
LCGERRGLAVGAVAVAVVGEEPAAGLSSPRGAVHYVRALAGVVLLELVRDAADSVGDGGEVGVILVHSVIGGDACVVAARGG